MRWFSHRRRTGGPHPENRSCKPPSACTAVTLSPLAATQWYRLLLRAAYGACSRERLTMHCQWGWLSSSSFFVPGDLELWPLTLTYKLGRHFCTMHLTAKFHRPTFYRSEVIVRTNKQTNRQTTLKKTSTALRYATPVGKSIVLWRKNEVANTCESSG